MSLPPGKSWFITRLVCEDITVADHHSTFIVEDQVLGGPIGHMGPHWKLQNYSPTRSRSGYNVIENFGAENATVPVAAVVRAVKEGNTTCLLYVGENGKQISTELNVSVSPLVNTVSYPQKKVNNRKTCTTGPD